MRMIGKILRAGGMSIAVLLVCSLFPLQAYAATPGTVGTWQTGNVVPDDLAWTSAVTYNGYVYVVSGADDFVYTNNVYFAKLNADGSVGTWSTTTAAPYAGSSISVLAYNGYMYYVGGFDGLANESAVHYAPINADGTLGSWTATTSALNTWSGATIAANNNYLYLLGGNTGTGPDDSVTYAPINANGSIGSWAATTAMPDTLMGGGAVVHNGKLYYVGGNNGIARQDTVYYATLNSDGTIGTWQTTTALPEERDGEGVAEYNGYLFSLGGWNASTITDTVYAAPINSDGSVGAWATATSLPSARTVAGVATYNGYVYNLAGLNISSAPTNTTYYATLSGYTPPTVHSVSATAVSGVSTTVDVLKNATDSPDVATLTIVSGSAHGSASVVSGKVVYTSTKGYTGVDSLVYQVCSVADQSVCSQATLTLNVVAAAPNTGFAPTNMQQLSSVVYLGLAATGLVGMAYWRLFRRESK